MKKFFSIISKPIVIVLLVLFVDQAVKIWIKTTMQLGEEFPVLGNWFYIHFVENPGMAFGMEIGGQWGKLALSLFRIVAICGIGYYLFTLPKKTVLGLKISIALIFAGAIGNILDSAFYGLIFNESFGQVATFLPQEGGYASFLYGRVVDMFWFPLVEGIFPSWVPIWGGEYYLFFRPVINIADASISIGIGMIFLFQRSYFKKEVAPVEENIV